MKGRFFFFFFKTIFVFPKLQIIPSVLLQAMSHKLNISGLGDYPITMLAGGTGHSPSSVAGPSSQQPLYPSL